MEQSTLFNLSIQEDQSLATNYNVTDLPLYLQEHKLSAFTMHRTPLHWNDDLESIYISQGQMRIIVNGQSIVLHEHEFCLIQPGSLHCFCSVNDEDCTYYCSLINESFFSYAADIKKKYVDPIFHGFHPDYYIVTSEHPYYDAFFNTLREIHSLCTDQPPAYELYLSARFHEYMALIWKNLQTDTMPVAIHNAKESESFRKILTHIHKNYGQKITIEDLCSIGCVSRNQCFILFKRYAQMTPSAYLLRYRLNHSRNLLRNTDIPIAEIASLCGFTHQSHYTNHFVKQYGITPFKFRKHH